MSRSPNRAQARKSRIHGTGLFASEDIAKGDKIIEYRGEKITKNEALRRYEEQAANGAIYLFDLNARYDVDGARHGNDARFANHSCDPNAETLIERGKIWILAKKDIQKGEEITYDYNFPLFDHEKRPCRCGTAKCRGWIISKSSYYYLRRKNGAQVASGSASRNGGKKTVKKAGKKVAKKVAKKTGTAAKRPTKRAGKKTRRATA